MMSSTSELSVALDALLAAHPGLPGLGRATRERLVAFVQLLARWNRVWNLTAIRDPQAMLERHVLDSLSLLPFIDAVPRHGGAADLLDIGSGAGLPVIPLAIARPELACVSVERTGKKVRFQRQAVLELALHGVEVIGARIEAVERRAAIVTSRAFTAPENFLHRAAAHVAPNGCALVMLGRAERLPATLPAPFRLQGVHRVDAQAARHVAVCVACAAESPGPTVIS